MKLKNGRYGLYLFNELDAYVGRSIDVYGEYGQHEADFFLSLPDHTVAVEVGANIGSLTLPISRYYKWVYAFEPQPEIFKILAANLALNSLVNAHCFPYGCSDENNEITLPHIDYNHPNNYGAFELEKYQGQGDHKVRIVRLDDFLDPPALDLLKVDVEGMELQVLKGAEKLIQKFSPVIFVENDRAHHSKALIEYLWSLGYKCHWHITPLFNENNHDKNPENVFGVGCSFNMACSKSSLPGLVEITDASDHPLERRMTIETTETESRSSTKSLIS